MASSALPARSDAAEHLKAVALRLFAQRGIDAHALVEDETLAVVMRTADFLEIF